MAFRCSYRDRKIFVLRSFDSWLGLWCGQGSTTWEDGWHVVVNQAQPHAALCPCTTVVTERSIEEGNGDKTRRMTCTYYNEVKYRDVIQSILCLRLFLFSFLWSIVVSVEFLMEPDTSLWVPTLIFVHPLLDRPFGQPLPAHHIGASNKKEIMWSRAARSMLSKR